MPGHVLKGFLGNYKPENYEEIVDNLVDTYRTMMGCRVSSKLHALHTHLYDFKEDMGDYSEEQDEGFHLDISSSEERYKGKYNESMMGDYIWNLLRESKLEYNRQSRSKNLKNVHCILRAEFWIFFFIFNIIVLLLFSY